jgi:protein NrfD
MVLFLFLVHLAIGILFSLLVVSPEAGIKFFRFNAGMVAVLIAVGLAFRPPEEAPTAITYTALWGVWATEAIVVLYWATIGRALTRVRPAILASAAAAGLVTLVAEGLSVAAGQPITVQALTVASFLSSAALLGGSCTAMVLGHWYLILPSMEVRHLQSIVKLHIVSMVVRVTVVGAAVFFAVATWEPGMGLSFGRYVLSIRGVFFWQRVLFGLAGPALLSYLTWETAKIRSTQSATGILYVDFFTVVVGEVLAKYILLMTRVPV